MGWIYSSVRSSYLRIVFRILDFDWSTNQHYALIVKTVKVVLYLIYVGTMFFNDKLMTFLGELEETVSKK